VLEQPAARACIDRCFFPLIIITTDIEATINPTTAGRASRNSDSASRK